MSLLPTPSQTVGPYFALGLAPLYSDSLTAPGARGERVKVSGRLFDGEGHVVPDAVVEIWQANANGRYRHPEDTSEAALEDGWRGFGRIPTDAQGLFSFSTIRPGAVAGPGGMLQAPHIVVLIGMRGLLRHLMTRIYFPDERAQAADPILALVPASRRATLIATAIGEGSFRWDIHLQGANETVFFDF